ncbi:hypothetical protein K402DRAFT_395501 [Aulographum hederae CBS 113979]|uniref:Glutathione transferase n=1 Tax=Aulographum hederae CBS 113979 TaxID=1176131 RepID=A0A6G1GVH3_9PEZI|nr:hypothetical protein K402DRAFT_395501 [Aulographum hederae CBS 113979]
MDALSQQQQRNNGHLSLPRSLPSALPNSQPSPADFLQGIGHALPTPQQQPQLYPAADFHTFAEQNALFQQQQQQPQQRYDHVLDGVGVDLSGLQIPPQSFAGGFQLAPSAGQTQLQQHGQLQHQMHISTGPGMNTSSPGSVPGAFQHHLLGRGQAQRAQNQLIPPHESTSVPTPTSATNPKFSGAERPRKRMRVEVQPNPVERHPPGADQPRQDTGTEQPKKRELGVHFQGLQTVEDPVDLEKWRNILFEVDELVGMSEEEFQIYFPHIDNVYSHRSSQPHKRAPFISHYYDCRLKGRPPGTKKDPNKKSRKRVSRKKNLCDVKIRITEFLPSATQGDVQNFLIQQPGMAPKLDAVSQVMQTGNCRLPSAEYASGQMSEADILATIKNVFRIDNVDKTKPLVADGLSRFYTIQRVNGNGANGKNNGVTGRHRHDLEESDNIKKNSVQRHFLSFHKEKRTQTQDKKTYHKKATGNAWNTVKAHSKEDSLKLFGSCFCPFVQRVWISLEMKQIPYQYIEVDPYKKPQSLLEVNPRGLVPALRHGDWGCYESTVLMEYLEDLDAGKPLLPPNAQIRANSRLWADHVNRHVIPTFYRLLQSQDTSTQLQHASDLKTEIQKLVEAADATGPFFLGAKMSFVDVQIAPWIIRLNRVLTPYRGWPEPEEGSRWAKWVQAIETEASVKATTSEDGLYLDSYQRYAENRPDTSQLAEAVNSGRGLP